MESSEEKTILEETNREVTEASNIGQSQVTVETKSAHTAITRGPVTSRNQRASSMKNAADQTKASSQAPKIAIKATRGKKLKLILHVPIFIALLEIKMFDLCE